MSEYDNLYDILCTRARHTSRQNRWLEVEREYASLNSNVNMHTKASTRNAYEKWMDNDQWGQCKPSSHTTLSLLHALHSKQKCRTQPKKLDLKEAGELRATTWKKDVPRGRLFPLCHVATHFVPVIRSCGG